MERLTYMQTTPISYGKIQKNEQGKRISYGDCVQKLGEYETLEELGLLMRLHCNVGSKIWIITKPQNYSIGKYKETILQYPQEGKVESITISKNGVLYHIKGRTYSDFDFGKKVFLFKEDAEQQLKEMENTYEQRR